MSILIVEDEVGIRLALIAQLESFGEIIAGSYRQALEQLQSLPPGRTLNLAVIDLMLQTESGMDSDAGFDVIEQLQSSFANTPVIVLTVRNDRKAWERSTKYKSIRYFFTKPWSSEELGNAVEKCLDGTAEGLTPMGKVEGINE